MMQLNTLFGSRDTDLLSRFNCHDCGVLCARTGNKQVRCSACAKKKQALLSKDYQRRCSERRRADRLVREASATAVCASCGASVSLLAWPRSPSRAKLKHCGCRRNVRCEPRTCECCGGKYFGRRDGRQSRWCLVCRPKMRSEQKTARRRRLGCKPRIHDAHVKAWASHVMRRPVLHDAHVRAWRACDARQARWRMRHDPVYVINQRMRTAIKKALRGKKAGRTWESIVGYSVGDLYAHLERQLPKRMTMSDLFLGRLHIDHIIPKSMFDVTKPEELRACWALANLRPLKAKDNLRKNARRTTLL